MNGTCSGSEITAKAELLPCVGFGQADKQVVVLQCQVDPLIWYDSNSYINFLHADHQGSITGVTNYTQGARINAYDEWGIPNATNVGPFQYTGQIWLPEIGMYHYKARIYSPTLGRFLQTDPVGYEGGVNLYAYVGNDPINAADPNGLACTTGSLTAGSMGADAIGCKNLEGFEGSGGTQRPRTVMPANAEAGGGGEGESTRGALSNTGDALRRLPGNVGRQIIGSLGCAARMDCSEDVRVGRWMSQEEADAMIETGLVQRPSNGTDQSYVTSPANADEFRRQAPEGSVFVTYMVRESSVYSSSAGGRSYISTGPNSLPSRVDVRRGLPAHTTPRARNIYIWTWP